MRRTFAILALLVLTGCAKVTPSGYGEVGRIAPIVIVKNEIPHTIVSDPDTLFDRIEKIYTDAPSGPENEKAGSPRDRFIRMSRNKYVPENSNYLITLQCGISKENDSYLNYDMNNEKAIISIFSRSVFERVKSNVQRYDFALITQMHDLNEIKVPGLGVSTRSINKEEHDRVSEKLEDDNRYIRLPNGKILFQGWGVLGAAIEKSNLRISGASLEFTVAMAPSTLVNLEINKLRQKYGSKPVTGSVRTILEDVDAWEKMPDVMPSGDKIFGEIPLSGGIQDVCLIGEFSHVDASDYRVENGTKAMLSGQLEGWYLVRRGGGKIVARTTLSSAIAG